MSLCDCPGGPRCEAYNGACGPKRADWTCMVPLSWKLPLRLGPKFFCTECRDRFVKAWNTPLKGIDRPEGVAPEDWKPSIMEHLRLCAIDAQINEQAEINRLNRPRDGSVGGAARHADDSLARPGDWRYTPAQLRQLYVLRRHLREEKRSSP